MWRNFLLGFLAMSLLLAPLSALSAPSSSPDSSSSQLEDQMAAALEQAREALVRSNEEIATQSRLLTRLWLLTGALSLIASLEAASLVIQAVKK